MATLSGFYVSFSGESKSPIQNIYVLSPSGRVLSDTVLDTSSFSKKDLATWELRGMAFDAAGNLYVCQAHKSSSAILRFGAPNKSSYTRPFIAALVTQGSANPGFVHPYQPAFSPSGSLFVSNQDSNIVTAYHPPGAPLAGQPMPPSTALPSGQYYPGTYVGAHSAEVGIPPNTPVHRHDGGLTFVPGKSTHSVRGIAFDNAGYLYVADQGNNRVEVFDPAGHYLNSITGSHNHQLSQPVALYFDGHETLYIGSPGNETLFGYPVSQAPARNFVARYLFSDSTKLAKLSGIAVDPLGHIYTGNRGDDTIYQWSPDGKHSSEFASGFGDSPEQIIAVYTAIVGGA